MFPLGELLVETPEDLDDTESRRCDGVREITTRWRHCADDTDGTFPFRVTQTLDATGSFVERGQTSSQVSGVTAAQIIRTVDKLDNK